MTHALTAVGRRGTHCIKAVRRRTGVGMTISTRTGESQELSAENPYWEVHSMTANKSKLKELKSFKNSKHVLKLKMTNFSTPSKDDPLKGMLFRMPGTIVPISLEHWTMRMIAAMQ